MADITRLAYLSAGILRGLDLTSNTLVVQSIKIGAGETELTQAILDNLITLQNGSDISAALHHHDGRYYTETELDAGQLDNRYFTETELSSNANGQGASLIGIEDAASQFTATTVEGALDEALDAAQAAQASADANTSDIADIRTTQGTSDGDTNLGTFTGTIIPDNTTVKGALQALETDVDAIQTLTGVAAEATNLGTFTGTTITDSSTIKTALQELEVYGEATRSLVQNFEFQNSAIDYIVDNTAVPPTEVTGDRYVLSHDGGAPNAGWDGASAGDIVEFNGTTWDATTPSLGMIISIDDETTSLRQWGGSSWDQKYFESTTASTGLTKVGFDIQLASSAAGDGLGYSSGVLSVNVDTSLAITTDTVGINFSTAYNDAKAVSAADLSAVTTGKGASIIGIEDAGALITATTVEGALAELATSIASLSGADIAYTPAVLTDWDGDADPGQVDDALDQLAARTTVLEAAGGNESVIETMVAGEAFSANTLYAVRMAKAADAGFVAGRVYKADKDASSADNFHVIGLIYETSAISATDSVTVYKVGKFDLGAAHGLTIGEEHFLGAAGAIIDGGASGANAPTTANDAVVSVGVAREANILEVMIEKRYVN